jgi:hypothetical protein
MPPQGEDTPHRSRRISGWRPCSDLQVRSLRALVLQGAWLELSDGKRNKLGTVLLAPQRAIRANCCETARSTAGLNTCTRSSLFHGTMRCVQRCQVAVAHCWLPIHSAWLGGTDSCSDSARCVFFIGPQRSTAAQACCAPTCDVGPLGRRQGVMSLRFLCRLSSVRRHIRRFTCTLRLHCFWTARVLVR